MVDRKEFELLNNNESAIFSTINKKACKSMIYRLESRGSRIRTYDPLVPNQVR